MFTATETFGDEAVGTTAYDNAASSRYRDRRGHKCAHELYQPGDGRIISSPANLRTGSTLGFESWYVNSLGATGDAALHDERGADIGVMELLPAGRSVYAMRARGVDGFLMMCSRAAAVQTSGGQLLAEATLYVAQAGWHEAQDELRVWADVGVDYGNRQVTLLPNCTAAATRENVDTLQLRKRSATPGRRYAGSPMGEGDPALLDDAWEFSTLSTNLGPFHTPTQARVCVGLQTGAGAEAVYVDSLRLREAEAGAGAMECAPSAGLAGVRDFASLAVPGSCDGAGGLLPPPPPGMVHHHASFGEAGLAFAIVIGVLSGVVLLWLAAMRYFAADEGQQWPGRRRAGAAARSEAASSASLVHEIEVVQPAHVVEDEPV